MIDSVRCEVLNVTYEPLRFVPARRGLRLVLDGKATMLEEHPTLFANTVDNVFPIPTRVVLHRLVKDYRPAHLPAQVTQRNLFLRDNFTCQYCGRHRTELHNGQILTRDHIYPQDRGGKDVWTNLVAACNSCNNKKANMVLKQFEAMYPTLKLRKQPTAPSMYEIYARASALRIRMRG